MSMCRLVIGRKSSVTSAPAVSPQSVALIFVPYITSLGGEERLLLSLSEWLHLRRCSHCVVCFDDTLGLASYATWPLQVVCLRPHRSVLREVFALRRYLSGRKAEIAGRILAVTMRSAIYCGLLAPAEFVMQVDDPPTLLPTDISRQALSARRAWPALRAVERGSILRVARAEIVHRLTRRGIRNARCVSVPTHRTAKELLALYGITSEVIPQGVKPPASQAPRGHGLRSPLRFLSVSRLEPNKRIDWILRALALLERHAPPLSARMPWVLDIVGQGSEGARLEVLALELGLRAKVEFHGRVSDERLDTIYQQAGIFLMPAVQGYGLPALEALIRQVPVLIHQDSGVCEVLQGSPWVEVVDEGFEALAEGISCLISRLAQPEVWRAPLPVIRTDQQWAEQVAVICGWNRPPSLHAAKNVAQRSTC